MKGGMRMKLITYARKQKPSETHVGILEGDQVYAIENWQGSMQELIALSVTPKKSGQPVALADVVIKPPLRPGKIIGVGKNYAEHAAEIGEDVPGEPLLFAKFTTCVIGDGAPISWSRSLTQQVDWEGELVVIIGSTGWNVPEAEAMDYIFGYTVGNDVSARDLQFGDSQWVRGKGLDTFGPMGPHIVTADEISDPHHLSIQTRVNGEVMQDSNTALMIFRIPRLIAFCSQAFTLEPGDVIFTGTPPGVGMGMDPQRFLDDGDEVSITVENVGTLTNPCTVRD
jgi:2-keto-4-pentenoate hydratase/2-oxohepta-3-ene-1,7-dioic acid hydratase in catechol pathway